jgi:hypothetical protein
MGNTSQQRKRNRERHTDRKIRLAHQRAAEKVTRRYVLPVLAVVILIIVVLFFYKYGLGSSRAGKNVFL